MKTDGNDLYRSIGGTSGCRQLATAFYTRVANDALLRPLFPGKSFRCAIEELTAFLVQLLGGPDEDIQFRWWLSLRESHLRFRIGEQERNAWMSDMVAALEDVGMEEPARGALLRFFQEASAYVVNQGEPPPAAVRRLDGDTDCEIGARWEAQRCLDETVAAIRDGNTDRAIRLAESAGPARWGRATFAGLLARMLGSGQGVLVGYVSGRVASDPALACERYRGRTLLHSAAGCGCLPVVELLLRAGADPNATDGGAHTPLYAVGNGCGAPDGAEIVRVLVREGARVDACEGVKRCTPLHMAARRGNVEVATALLACGANIEARDSQGETPLRRAVNCNQIAVASLLLAQGADRRTIGSKGLTPLQAARSEAMRRLFRSTTP